MSYKSDFPIFEHHKQLVYLDNAATSQKPKLVIDALANYYARENGSPHRGAHELSIKSTIIYDKGREAVKQFVGADDRREIIFTRNATESLNLIAYGYLDRHLASEHNIVLSITNHHSNILPFQRLCQKTGAELRYLYVDLQGRLLDGELDKIDDKTLLVSIPLISNGLGVKLEVSSIFKRAKEHGALRLLDAAQAVGHEHVNVQSLEADLMVFSGHKMFAPQGIGVLYGRFELLDQFDPFLSGGDMIEYVQEQTSTYADLPDRLEAGTQNVSGVLGLLKALEYIDSIGIDTIKSTEQGLTAYAYNQLRQLDYVQVYGPNDIRHRGALVTFNVKEVHPHDVASILDNAGVAIRAGHHCCQPLMHYMKTASTCRASFSLFNTKEDVDQLIKALETVKDVFYE
jgi:cysteine desulfurase/selenocysteine lyase